MHLKQFETGGREALEHPVLGNHVPDTSLSIFALTGQMGLELKAQG